MTTTPRLLRLLLGCVLGSTALAACKDAPTLPELRPVVSGTISGVSFSVIGGTVLQATTDGPVYADASGGRLLFAEDPAGLGMSDPRRLQLRTQFALAADGSLQIAAFAGAGSDFSTGLSVALRRSTVGIEYEFLLSGALFADSLFLPAPTVPSAEHWIVTEFYAENVPGYPGGRSGIAMWPLNDLTPAFAEDVLGCVAGPAMQPSTLTGDRVGYALRSGWIIAVDVVDEIVGPCE